MKGPFFAIVGDTWRQSKHQMVLLVLLMLLAMTVPLLTLFIKVSKGPDGTEFLTVRFEEEGRAQRGFDQGWDGLYADALKQEIGLTDEIRQGRRKVEEAADRLSVVDFQLKQLEHEKAPEARLASTRDARRDAEVTLDEITANWKGLMTTERDRVDQLLNERTAKMSRLQKGVEYWLSGAVTLIYILSMLGFIAVSAGYVPLMIEAGSIDLVLSKPIRRWHLFYGKYVGGLLLYSIALVAAYVVVFLGVGAVSGVWHWPFFYALPMTIFSLGLLYAIVGWVGLWTRSTTMAMVIGYLYYLVVDTAVAFLADPTATPFLAEMPGVEAMADLVKHTFPSFKWLRESAEATVFSVWVFPWQHVVVGAVWLVVCLGTAFNRFRINDY